MSPRARERDRSRLYVWFDAEFTSLDLDRARLLQAAVIVTDCHLRRVGPARDDLRVAVAIPPRTRLSPWVRENLASAVARSRGPGAVPAGRLDRRLAAWMDRLVGRPRPAKREHWPVLAGNSIHTDWFLVRRHLPRFAERLNYRHLDVSALKLLWLHRGGRDAFDKDNPEAVRRYFPGARLGDAAQRHDAYYDVQASIAELSFYRAHLLKAAD